MGLTYSYSSISSAQTNPDSPIDTTLMEQYRQNQVHNYEMVVGNSGSYTPSTAHDHDGTNSARINPTIISTSGTTALAASASWTPDSGVYQMTCDGNARVVLALYVNSSWHTPSAVAADIGGIGYFDSTNMRVTNISTVGAVTVAYQKF